MNYKIGDEVKSKATGLKCIISKFETNMRKEDVVVLIGDEGTLKLEREYFEKNFILMKNSNIMVEKSKYEIKSVVCDYGIYEDGKLILILNDCMNARYILDILKYDENKKRYPNIVTLR